MNCPQCQAEILEFLETGGVCPACGASLSPTTEKPAATRVSELAAASLILALVGLVPCSWFLPLFSVGAIVCGVAALVALRRQGGRLTGRRLAWAGITLGALVTGFALFSQITANLEAQVRVQVARDERGLRSIASALEAYRQEWHTYPQSLARLTTPVAYLSEVPVDSCSPQPHHMIRYAPGGPLAVGDTSATVYGAWIAFGCGPDGVYDIEPVRDLPPDADLSPEEVTKRLLDKTYNPSNGTKSCGDIFRCPTLP